MKTAMVRRWLLPVLLASVASGVLANGARAESKDFSLIKAVPADVFLCVAGQHNPESKFVDEYWARVFDALKESGIWTDVRQLLASAMGSTEQQQMDEFVQLADRLFSGVNWGELASKEMVFAERLGRVEQQGDSFSMGPPDLIFLMRGTKENAQGNFDGLVAIQQTLLEMANSTGEVTLTLDREEVQGMTASVLRIQESAPPMSLAVARKGDVIAILFGDKVLSEVATLLGGDGGDKSLAATPRFRTAIEPLPKAEDGLVFFDMQLMLKPIRQLVDAALPKAAPDDQQAAAEQWPQKLADRLFRTIGVMDYAASVNYTDGYAQYEDSRTVLVPDASSSPIYDVFANVKPITQFDRFVPEEANSFSVSAGMDLTALYEFIRGSFETAGEPGQNLWKQWEGLQQQFEFNLKNDLLSWMQGQTVSVTIGEGMGAASVTMLKVSDEEKAGKQVTTALDAIQTQLRELSATNPMLGMLAIQRSPETFEGLEGFERIVLAANPAQPMVWGVKGGFLIFATSAEAVSLCIKTAAGEHPSVRKNERIMAELVLPKNDFHTISFTDLRNLGTQISQTVSGITMGAGMALMAIPDPQAQKLAGKAMGIVAKLGNVAKKLDFYRSSSALTHFDGKEWRTRSVTHYQPVNAEAAQ